MKKPINVRIEEKTIDKLKKQAKKRGLPFSSFIQGVCEWAVRADIKIKED